MNKKMSANENKLGTKTKILSAAKQEFFEKGFMNASVRSIAERAGLTTGAIYNQFKNKEAVFETLVADVFR